MGLLRTSKSMAARKRTTLARPRRLLALKRAFAAQKEPDSHGKARVKLGVRELSPKCGYIDIYMSLCDGRRVSFANLHESFAMAWRCGFARGPALGPRFEDHVEWRLRNAPEPSEASGRPHLPQL